MRVQVYGICSPVDGRIRYVGQTNQPLSYRLSTHISHARTRGLTTHLYRWLQQLDRQGLTPVIFLIDGCAVRNETEKRLIAWYRRNGAKLVNISDGGDGAIGPRSDAHRKAISEALRGKKKSPEHRAALAAALIGRPLDADRAAKLAEARRKPKLNKAPPFSAEHRAKISAANRGFKMPESAKRKIGDAKRLWWAQKREANG